MKYNKYTAFARAENKAWIYEKAKSYKDAEQKADKLFEDAQYDYAGVALNAKERPFYGDIMVDKLIVTKRRD